MSNDLSIQDHTLENRIFLRRTLLAAIVILMAMGLLVGRLIHLQVLNHQHYKTLSQENRVRLVPIPPPRGMIYDRNGVVLAENRPSFRLVITPEQVEDIDATLAELGKLVELSELELKRFEETRKRSRRFQEIPLKLQLTEAEVARVAVNRHQFPGVEIRARLTRYYPQGHTGVHALGYVGRINRDDLNRLDPANYSASTHTGKTGVERYYEDLLHGKVGMERVETNARGRVIRTLERIPPVPGKDIHLTLDLRLQRAAEAALGEETGAIVAIEPATGEILAFVSKPTYDPNPFVDGLEVEEFRDLRDAREQPLFNRALRGQYPPGSTIKPMVALAALENGVIDMQEKILCKGYYMLPDVDHRYRCWKRSGMGWHNMAQAIAQSNDVYFYDVSYRLGIDAMSSFLARFDFGKTTGIDLLGEASGILPSREWKKRVRGKTWFHGETLITSIGQGFMLSTPLQMAHWAATIANRGERMTPHVLLAQTTPGESEKTVKAPEPLGPPIELRDDKRWDQIINAMRQVVHGPRGTANHISNGLDYQIAGKTGTSQVFSLRQDQSYEAEELARELRTHALFIGFAPADKPKIAVAVIIEHGGGGGAVAAPVARQVLDAYLKTDNHADR